ncbi:mechanosensitive ion channel family protein [Coprothermobacter platensis]|uniref:mechanosensitive ion channel family protein n=1 Tax=Coprothermobacter platensis TaxID=108819 RepID=UPI0003AA3FE8|nr:mechanosensitive ion channel family protein [Coprothermobacter platensis]
MGSFDDLYGQLLSFLNNIMTRGFYVLLAILFFILVQRITVALIKSSKVKLQAHPSISGITISFWLSFFYYVVVIIAFLGALRIAGMSYTSILAGVSITGLVVGLATQNILANLFAGMMILAQKPFDIGDWVTINNFSGSVKAINVLTTNIETLERTEITIPNKLLVEGPIINNTRSANRLWNFSFYIDCPQKYLIIKEKLLQMLREDKRVVEEPTVFVELSQSGVKVTVRAAVKTSDIVSFGFSMQESILSLLNEEGCHPLSVAEIRLGGENIEHKH